MEFSDDSDLSDRSKTRLKDLLERAKEIERYRRDSEVVIQGKGKK
jgi:hypothetical protein